MIFDNQNNVYETHGFSYQISQNDLEFAGTLDSETGEIKFKRIIEINSLPPDTKYFTLQLSLEIFDIPGENSLNIDLQHHSIDEEWMLNEEIVFAGIPLQLEKAIIKEPTEQNFIYSINPEGEESITQETKLQLEIWGISKFSPEYEIIGFYPRKDDSNIDISDPSAIVVLSGSTSDGMVSSRIPLNISIENNTIYSLEDSITFSFIGSILVNKLWELTWVLDEQP